MINTRHLIPLALVSALAIAAPLTMLPSPGYAQIGVSITVAPPALPVYAQPVIPGDGYLWQPGYWAYGTGGYYWVPGTWVQPPSVGLLWTPGYWGWLNGSYAWHAGYWGPHVGFYGGINYGFGYTGSGYSGGRWDNGHFAYNRAANNIGRAHVANVYSQPIHAGASHVSFNGGTRGTRAQPGAAEQAAAKESHTNPSPEQMQHEQAAAGRHAQFSSANHGRPPVAASAKPATFTGRGVVGTRPQHRAQPAAAHAPAAPQHQAQPAAARPAPAHPAPAAHAAPAAHPAPAQGGGKPDKPEDHH